MSQKDGSTASGSRNGLHRVVQGIPAATLPSLSSLNPLTRDTSGRKSATTRGRPAEPVALSQLPNVTKSELEPYLAEVQAEWTRWERSRSGSSGAAAGQGSSFGSELDENEMRRRRLALRDRTELPALDSVPEIFFEESFNLAEPRTFDAVTSDAGVAGPSDTTRPPLKRLETVADLATDVILPEKLSRHLDVVELHLAQEITKRSPAFFAALANLQQLSTQSTQALQQLAAVRERLKALDENQAKRGLEAVKAMQRRQQLEALARAVERLKSVWAAVEDASQLAEHGEWETCLALIDEIEHAIEVEEPNADGSPPVRLSRLKALASLPTRLSRLRAAASKSLQNELVNALAPQIDAAVKSYDGRLEMPIDSSERTAWTGRDEARQRAEARLRPIIRTLAKCGPAALEDAVLAWKDNQAKVVRNAVREDLPSAEHDADESFSVDATAPVSAKSAVLAQRLRDMSHAEFMQLTRSTCQRLLAHIEVADVHAAVILALVQETRPSITLTEPGATDSTPSSDEPFARIANETADAVHAAAELANLRFSKIVGARSEVHAALPLHEFASFFALAWAFVIRGEVVCKRMIVGLRGVMITQAKSFLSTFHGVHISESAKVVEVEQWSPAEVTSEQQRTTQLIIDSAVSDPPSFKLGAEAQPHANGNSTSSKTLDIEGRPFHAVAACLRVLDLLTDYLRVIVILPLLTTEAMSRVIEFLKQFNSRTCQVVLGAGAMRSAGLKNLTAKHLALASQALSIMISLIPYVREALRRHLNPKQAVMLVEFDKLKRDYQEHQYEIHAKLIAIMADRLAVHATTLQGIDFGSDAAGPGPSTYIESLVKEVATLHRVLSKYLQLPTLELVIGQVLSAINSRLADEYQRVELKTDKAKERLLVDVRFLRSRFAELKGLERVPPGEELERLVQGRMSLETANRPPPAPEPEPEPPVVEEPPAVAVEETKTDKPTAMMTAEPEETPAPPEQPAATSPAVPEKPLLQQKSPVVQQQNAVRNRLAGLFARKQASVSSPELVPQPISARVSSELSQPSLAPFDTATANTSRTSLDGAEDVALIVKPADASDGQELADKLAPDEPVEEQPTVEERQTTVEQSDSVVSGLQISLPDATASRDVVDALPVDGSTALDRVDLSESLDPTSVPLPLSPTANEE